MVVVLVDDIINRRILSVKTNEYRQLLQAVVLKRWCHDRQWKQQGPEQVDAAAEMLRVMMVMMMVTMTICPQAPCSNFPFLPVSLSLSRFFVVLRTFPSCFGEDER